MSPPQGALPEFADDQPRNTRSVPEQIGTSESTAPTDKNVPLVGHSAMSVRPPRPAYLTWVQMKEIDKDQTAERTCEGPGASDSGTVSPVSISFSEALRTPHLAERQKHPYKHPSSPGGMSQLPPRVHSPASQIFERSVQEDILPLQASPSIPAHIRTENYIPPVLEASSAAITDEQLNPDSVEILTHSLHQPAGASVTGASTAEQSLASSGIVDHAEPHPADSEELSSAYSALDTNDVRRLSFISFADVVNAEHAETGEPVYSRDHSQTATAEYSVFTGPQNRSPSPLRSPVSSHGLGTSPPTSIAASFKGLEMPPPSGARGTGSPFSMAQSPVSSNFGGELTVETMSQALRRTGSGDLGGVASQTASAFGNDEPLDRSF
ncbi:uncharacterized protein N7459_000749 [Penicillium hispanicum]|uniref:uncharacterized protein n=1 Tax=Penicillium hispanicum TaxID=1080232 RepID=UPI002541E420|nr:uncharacterized protein N7459_000749 [Penicillium hispanicum]KAJ5594541.1 hypothetical protein N7459_000749 [Penicillium hispanicum]